MTPLAVAVLDAMAATLTWPLGRYAADVWVAGRRADPWKARQTPRSRKRTQA